MPGHQRWVRRPCRAVVQLLLKVLLVNRTSEQVVRSAEEKVRLHRPFEYVEGADVPGAVRAIEHACHGCGMDKFDHHVGLAVAQRACWTRSAVCTAPESSSMHT